MTITIQDLERELKILKLQGKLVDAQFENLGMKIEQLESRILEDEEFIDKLHKLLSGNLK